MIYLSYSIPKRPHLAEVFVHALSPDSRSFRMRNGRRLKRRLLGEWRSLPNLGSDGNCSGCHTTEIVPGKYATVRLKVNVTVMLQFRNMKMNQRNTAWLGTWRPKKTQNLGITQWLKKMMIFNCPPVGTWLMRSAGNHIPLLYAS